MNLFGAFSCISSAELKEAIDHNKLEFGVETMKTHHAATPLIATPFVYVEHIEYLTLSNNLHNCRLVVIWISLSSHVLSYLPNTNQHPLKSWLLHTLQELSLQQQYPLCVTLNHLLVTVNLMIIESGKVLYSINSITTWLFGQGRWRGGAWPKPEWFDI